MVRNLQEGSLKNGNGRRMSYVEEMRQRYGQKHNGQANLKTNVIENPVTLPWPAEKVKKKRGRPPGKKNNEKTIARGSLTQLVSRLAEDLKNLAVRVDKLESMDNEKTTTETDSAESLPKTLIKETKLETDMPEQITPNPVITPQNSIIPKAESPNTTVAIASCEQLKPKDAITSTVDGMTKATSGISVAESTNMARPSPPLPDRGLDQATEKEKEKEQKPSLTKFWMKAKETDEGLSVYYAILTSQQETGGWNREELGKILSSLVNAKAKGIGACVFDSMPKTLILKIIGLTEEQATEVLSSYTRSVYPTIDDMKEDVAYSQRVIDTLQEL